MHEHELKSIGLHAAQRAVEAGGLLLKVSAPFYSGGSSDFIGGQVVTMSAGGPGKLIGCLKCRDCGHSVTPNAEFSGARAAG